MPQIIYLADDEKNIRDLIAAFLTQEAVSYTHLDVYKRQASLYVSSKLDEKDKYAVFLGGN